MDRGAWWATVHGFAKVVRDLATKQQQGHLENFQICLSGHKLQNPRKSPSGGGVLFAQA